MNNGGNNERKRGQESQKLRDLRLEWNKQINNNNNNNQLGTHIRKVKEEGKKKKKK